MIFKTHHARDLEEDYGGVEIGKYTCSRNCGIFGVESGTGPVTTGGLGLYSEDSEVLYDHVLVRRLDG
jgi:hypothetical protein